MAKNSSQLMVGAAVAVGGLFLWSKFGKGATVDAVTTTGQVIPIPVTSSGQVDTTSAAYHNAVAAGVQQIVANMSTPNNCTQTPWGPVCPSNFNNPTLAPIVTTPVTSPTVTPPTPPVCGTGMVLNDAKTACVEKTCPQGYQLNADKSSCVLIPPPPSAPYFTSGTSWSNSPEMEEICSNGALMRRPVGSGTNSSWVVVGQCVASTQPKCREVPHPYIPGVLNMDPKTFVGGIPSVFITPPTPSWTEIVCD